MKAPVCVDLFCGCGGLSTGLLNAGVDVRLGIDLDAPSLATFDLDHAGRGSHSLLADVRDLSGVALRNMVGGKVDLLVGGPPCQPFGVAGKRQGLADRRGDLIFEYVRLLDELRPNAFIFENVPNLATVADGAVLDGLLEAFRAVEYAASASVLLAADYGVPQMRRRLFVVGTRSGEPIDLPPLPTHGEPRTQRDLFESTDLAPYQTAQQALQDLPDVTDP